MPRILIIVIVTLASIATGLPSNVDQDEVYHLNLMKQSLTIRQIQNKLLRYYSNKRNEFNSREIRYRNGASNIWEEKSNINDILESIVMIKPQDPSDGVYKKEVILLGRIVNQSRNSLSVEFDLQPHHLSANSVSLRLFTDTRNKYFVRWQVSNSYNNIRVKRQTVLSTNSNQFYYYHIPIGELTSHENETPNSTMDDNDELVVRFTVEMRPGISINMAMLWVELDMRQLYPQLKSNRPRYNNAMRSTPAISCFTNQVFCCLQNFSISPSEIGMDNIRNHEKISLNYCRGECNSNSPRISTHRRLLDIFRHSNSPRLSPLKLARMRSCCSPSRYADLEVQYFNRPNKEVIPNMIITACGCH